MGRSIQRPPRQLFSPCHSWSLRRFLSLTRLVKSPYFRGCSLVIFHILSSQAFASDHFHQVINKPKKKPISRCTGNEWHKLSTILSTGDLFLLFKMVFQQSFRIFGHGKHYYIFSTFIDFFSCWIFHDEFFLLYCCQFLAVKKQMGSSIK